MTSDDIDVGRWRIRFSLSSRLSRLTRLHLSDQNNHHEYPFSKCKNTSKIYKYFSKKINYKETQVDIRRLITLNFDCNFVMRGGTKKGMANLSGLSGSFVMKGGLKKDLIPLAAF